MKKYYFVGIKGAGMSSLAIILNDLGYEVTGYDGDKRPKFTEENLIAKNIKIYYDDSYELTDEIVVHMPAINKEHPEIKRALEKGLEVLKYNEMLGVLTESQDTIALQEVMVKHLPLQW